MILSLFDCMIFSVGLVSFFVFINYWLVSIGLIMILDWLLNGCMIFFVLISGISVFVFFVFFFRVVLLRWLLVVLVIMVRFLVVIVLIILVCVL